MPVEWGGKDNYEYSFKPENHENDTTGDKTVYVNGTSTNYHNNNNNDAQHENLNLLQRKVSEQNSI